jgi:hypothetical protein
MTNYDTLYMEQDPIKFKKLLAQIPDNHKKSVLDTTLEKAIVLVPKPNPQHIRNILSLGANPNGPNDEPGSLLGYAYSVGLDSIVELLLNYEADVNAPQANVLELAVCKADLKAVVRFVEAGAKLDCQLLFGDNLLKMAADHPKIQKYLIHKGYPAKKALQDKLADVSLVKLEDFVYPTIEDPVKSGWTPQDKSPMNLEIQQFSDDHFVVCGDTRSHQQLLRKHKARFCTALQGCSASRGWIVSNKHRKELEAELQQLQPAQISTPTPAPTPISNNLLNIPSPIIELWSSAGPQGFMTVSFCRPKLFIADRHYWDSLERYLMFKRYEGSHKASAIRLAETLQDARRKYLVTSVPFAKTPKQLLINQKLQPLAESKLNKKNLENFEKIFYRANRLKFEQNSVFRNQLIKCKQDLINRNANDEFGYEGNRLGNSLMKLRCEFLRQPFDPASILKTNNLTIQKYNTKFYVVRGNPDDDLAQKLRTLGSYKGSNGKIVRGKLSLNLIGGPGWLIPGTNRREAKELVFKTYPNCKKITVCGKNWIKKKTRVIVEAAALFSKFRGHQEIGSDDTLFAIKNIFAADRYLGLQNDGPSTEFSQMVSKEAKKTGSIISHSAIQLLWEVLSQMILELNIENYEEMKAVIENQELALLDQPIDSVEGLIDRETIVLRPFNRLYRLLSRLNDDVNKVSVLVIHLMLGDKHYEKIRGLYSKASKQKATSSGYSGETAELQKRFKICCPHISEILKLLPKTTNKKCKLLLFVTLDYIMALPGDEAVKLNKRLLLMTKAPEVTPTPQSIKLFDELDDTNHNRSDQDQDKEDEDHDEDHDKDEDQDKDDKDEDQDKDEDHDKDDKDEDQDKEDRDD